MKLGAVPGVEVSILKEGAPLREYDDEETDEKDRLKGVKYVEATPGSNFTVFLSVRKSELVGHEKDHLRCSVSLDGKGVYSTVLGASGSPSYFKSMKGQECTIKGQRYLQRFTFAELNTTDGPVDGFKTVDLRNLGEIQVKLRYVHSKPAQQNTGIRTSTPAAETIVPEKCMKEKWLKGQSISSKAALGKPEPIVPRGGLAERGSVQVEYPYGLDPFATFTFKYRTRKDLQNENIIPRSPTPVPLEERDPDDLSPDEARELVRRLRARDEANNIKVKKEKRDHAVLIEDDEDEDDDEDDEEITMSQVRDRKRARTSTESGMEIIDLSGD